MIKPVAPRKDDYANHQCYLDAYYKYTEAHDLYHDWLETESQRLEKQQVTVDSWRKRQAAELAAMKHRDEEDELLAYASLQELKREQWRERVRRAIEDD